MRPAATHGLLVVALAGLAVWGQVACDGGSGGTGGVGGAGGGGGGSSCPEGVSPLFALRVQGPDQELPSDLTLAVSWSAGDEPPVVVDQPGTFGTSTSNVICALRPRRDADGGGGAGGEAARDEELVCELWTSGPTRIELTAAGFVAIDETLVPATVDGCDRPVPSEVVIALVVEDEEDPQEE